MKRLYPIPTPNQSPHPPKTLKSTELLISILHKLLIGRNQTLFQDEPTFTLFSFSQWHQHYLNLSFLFPSILQMSEELQLAILRQIRLLFQSALKPPPSHPKSYLTTLGESQPQEIAFGVTTFLDILSQQKNRNIRLEVLHLLQDLLAGIPAEISAAFLPGVASALTKVLRGDYKQVTVSCLVNSSGIQSVGLGFADFDQLDFECL